MTLDRAVVARRETRGRTDTSCEVDGFATDRTLLDTIARTVQTWPQRGVEFTSRPRGRRWSYSAWLEGGERVLGGLRGQGLRPGTKIPLLLNRPEHVLPAFWGCVLGGLVPYPLPRLPGDPARARAHLAHLTALLGAPVLITSAELVPGLSQVTDVRWAEIERLQSAAQDSRRSAAHGDDVAVRMLTSGSTGMPKAVTLTHRNLVAWLAAHIAAQSLSESDTTLNCVAV